MKISEIKDTWDNPKPGVWYNPKSKRKWRQIYHEKTCLNCGEQFAASHKHLKYCSYSCSSSHRQLGKNSHRWRGGKFTDKHGYVCVLRRDHPDATKPNFYIKEHRLVAEKMIGRRLLKTEVVHHKNGIKDDNRPENLSIMNSSKHTSLHNLSRYRKE